MGEGGPWVSKTDVIQYERCPYRVALNYQEGIPYGEFLKPELRNFFFAGGIEFETEVVKEAVEHEELRIATSVEDIRSQEGLARVLSPILNHELGMTGMPDLIKVERGRLIPVEIKNHSDVTWYDQIELAFYWQLLEPVQKGHTNRGRRGYVQLRSGETRKVYLYSYHFNLLNELISEVRTTKLEGIQPKKVPECDRCVFRDDHLPQIFRAGDVSLIYDVGPKRGMHLEELGIESIKQLTEVDSDDLYARWRRSGRVAPGLNQIKNMQAHGRALLTYEPQVIGDNRIPELGKALIMDLEYLPDQIFVIGILVVEEGEKLSLHQEFANDPRDERALLASLRGLLKSFSAHSIVTWNGTGADIPMLKWAWDKLKLSEKTLQDIEQRHLDLYSIVKANLRLPTSSLGLKDVASYFGFERAHPDIDSMLIPMKYSEYLRTNQPTLKQEILDHNADDLRSLLLTWSRLLEISVSSN